MQRQGATSPPDCVLLVAIPLTQREFLCDLTRTDGGDFAKSYARQFYGMRPEILWANYREQAGTVERAMSRVAAHGAHVIANATLADLGPALSSHKVSTLVAHWRHDAIELRDAMHPTNAVLSRIPQDFSGLLDLSVCQCELFGMAVKRARSGCNVRISRGRVSLGLQMLLYAETIGLLAEEPTSFIDASHRLRKKLLERTR